MNRSCLYLSPLPLLAPLALLAGTPATDVEIVFFLEIFGREKKWYNI